MKTLRYFLTILMVCAIALAHAQTPVAYYPFNGNANDAVGSNNGSVNGATLTTDRFGNPNSAYSFDGVDDFISVPSGTFTAYTITAWVKFSGSNSSVGIVTFTETFGGWSHQIGTIGSGQFYHYLYTTSNRGFAQSGTTGTNQDIWYHVTITASANGQMKLYVNGVPDAIPVSITGGPWVGGTRFDFGAGRGGFSWLNGSIDEVKIFNTQLTDSEVLADFNATTPPPPPSSSPIAYYPFNGNANDAAGSNNGTVNGATLTTDRFGNPNSAYSFDGVDDFIATANVITTVVNNWALTAWVKPSSNIGVPIIVQNGYDDGVSPCGGYALGLQNGNVGGYLPCVTALNGGASVSNNQWVFLAMVREAGTTKFYVNGVLSPTTSASAPNTPFGALTIGSASGIRFFNGAIDEVKIYNTALTGSQVLDEYTSSAPNFGNYGSQFGNSVFLNGLNDYINCAGTTQNLTNALTIEAWINVPALPATGKIYEIVSKRSYFATSHQDFPVSLQMGSSGAISFLLSKGDDFTTDLNLTSVTTLQPNTWYHVAATYLANGTAKLYLNGVQEASGNASFTISSNSQPWVIGRASQENGGGINTSYTKGYVDEVRLWSVARTASEIAGNMNSQLAGGESGLVGYWDMNRSGAGAGLTVQNKATSTGTALDGTTFGTASTPVFSGESVLGIEAPAPITAITGSGACSATVTDLGVPVVTGENIPENGVTNDAPSIFPIGVTVVTWTVTDNSGNTATATQTVTVTDTELPTITAPVALYISTRENACDAVDVALGQPTVSDNCGVASVTNNAPATYPLGTTTVTWTVTDNSGNTATATQTVTVTDTALPTITAPAALNISTRENACDAVDVALGQPTVSDNCGIASVTNNAPEAYPLGTTTVTWTVMDNNGNVATATQTVTVVDEQDPLVNAPADVTVQIAPDADSATGVSLGGAQASDNCGVASVTNNAPTTFPIGTTVVTWTATDNSGNTATATQNVTVTREVLPTITAPAAINVDTDAGDCFATLADLGTPSVTGEDILADGISNDAPETFPVGTTIVTWTVRDGNGNTATATQQVTVTDRELPAITAPAAVQTSTGTTSCDAVDVALGQPTVSDNCGIASVTNDAPETYPLGTTTVTWTVTDNNGNVSTATQTVTVVDEQDPLVNAPADVTIQIAPDADSATGVALGEAQASDNCGVASVTNNAPTTFPIGTTVVTWTATDNSGNTSTATQNVTVTREVLPTITAPAAINMDTDTGDCFATLADLGTPSVTGEDIPADGISNDAPETFPVGTTTVTWTVRDGNGNTATATQQVTVTDRELPAITAPAAVQTSTGTTSCDAVNVALGQATVSDNCGIASVTNNAPDTYPLGTTTVTWTVTDNNGNVATATQTVTVVDEQDPLVTAPADVTVQVGPDEDSATGVALGEAQASDNCGIQSLTNDAPNELPIGLTVVTWTATDNSGNTATAQQRVNVTREELPTINAPAEITTDADEGECFAEGLSLGSPTFTGTGATVSNDAPDQFPVGVTTVTWTVTDANGNTATAVQQVTVADKQAPQLTAPGNIAASEGGGGDAPAIDLGNAVATDNCGIASIENDAPAVFPVGMTVVKWTATDVNGNKSTALQVVTVDAVTPVCTIQIKTKQEITVVLNKNGKGRLTTGMVDDGTASNCGPVVLKLSECDFSCADIGEQKITFTAVDAVGSKASTEVTIRVVDQTKPKVTVPQQPYVKVIRRGDTFVMPDLRNRVTASDNCGFELHQCPEPGKVFRKAHNGWIEFEAKDPSGNVGKGKMRFRLLVVGCRKPAKNGREELEGSESLITVPWNTSLPKIASDYVYFEEGSDMELAQQIKWSISDFDPLKPGFYQMVGSLPAEYLEEGDNGPAISLPVLVLNKPLPVDIFAAKDRVSHKVRTGEILTGLHTVDPADDIHSYSMDEHPDVYLENNVLVWRGNHMPEARTAVTVHSTDRAGQTISRQITLYRETDRPTDLLIYPNPAMQETNLMVQIPDGSNVSIRIFDAAGRLVYQEEGQHELSFTRKIDLRHFAQGMYQVIVQVDRETLQGRIIKQ